MGSAARGALLSGVNSHLLSGVNSHLLAGARVVFERVGRLVGWLREHALLAVLATLLSLALCLVVVRCARLMCSRDGAERRSLWHRYIKVVAAPFRRII